MKRIVFIVIGFAVPSILYGQQSEIDSLRMVLENAASDSMRYVTTMQLGYYYSENNRDSSIYYYETAKELAGRKNNVLAEATALSLLGYQNTMTGKYAKALQYLTDGFNAIEKGKHETDSWMFVPGFSGTPQNYKDVVLSRHQALYSVLMRNTGNTEQEILYLKKSIETAKRINYIWRIAVSDLNLSGAYLKLNKPDSAFSYVTEGLKLIQQTTDRKYESALLIVSGDIQVAKANRLAALDNYRLAMKSAYTTNATSHICWVNFALCKYFLDEKNKDSSLYYAKNTLRSYLSSATPAHIFNISDVYEHLFKSYQLNNRNDSAHKYLEISKYMADSIYKNRIATLSEFQNLGFAEQLRLRDVEKKQLAYQSRIRTYALLAGIAFLMLIAFLLYRNSRNRKKSNIQLYQQKNEIENQKNNLEITLNELRAAQKQLIQSEKMASLGELTAGIAHEIQNPLNFVNNFSEVNTELIEEMKEELKAGKTADAISLADDIKANNEKIAFHGKRADSIVKGMLQHSRNNSGQKELTDINNLVDECLRLSFHGMRAKDKSFNAKTETSLDNSLSPVTVVSQEIGRVLLNLFTNAFYSVMQKKKTNGENYSPVVTASTFKVGNTVKIIVRDNGNGISQKVIDKIFQPFFTTKPTGEGTGLGLSMSYDIITKGHGGDLNVETKEGEFAQFTIILPYKP